MSIPTIDGQAAFGSYCWVAVGASPRQSDLTATFGQDGLGNQDGGGRGTPILVSGWLAGPGPSGLAATEATVRGFADGRLHQLIDSLGITWPNVFLESFQPNGRARQDNYGQYYRSFTCRLRYIGA